MLSGWGELVGGLCLFNVYGFYYGLCYRFLVCYDYSCGYVGY